MTDRELARLQALADEASPGPWNTEGRWVMNAKGSEVAETVMLDDAEFIAAARAAVPALIAELRCRNNELARKEQTLGELRRECDRLRSMRYL